MTNFLRWVSTMVVGMLEFSDDPGCRADQHHAGTAKRVRPAIQGIAPGAESLLRAQEKRVALPKDLPQRLKEFLESSWSFQGRRGQDAGTRIFVDMERGRDAGDRPRPYKSGSG